MEIPSSIYRNLSCASTLQIDDDPLLISVSTRLAAADSCGMCANSEVMLKMLADDRYCGRIIGKEGKMIKKIREDTVTKITVSKYDYVPVMGYSYITNLLSSGLSSSQLIGCSHSKLGEVAQLVWLRLITACSVQVK